MTNQWVCMTSSSEHSFVRDLGKLSTGMSFRVTDVALMEKGVKAGVVDKESVEDLNLAFHTSLGQKVIDWIEAYADTSGGSRSCWVGEKKRMVCMTWREADSSDDEV